MGPCVVFTDNRWCGGTTADLPKRKYLLTAAHVVFDDMKTFFKSARNCLTRRLRRRYVLKPVGVVKKALWRSDYRYRWPGSNSKDSYYLDVAVIEVPEGALPGPGEARFAPVRTEGLPAEVMQEFFPSGALPVPDEPYDFASRQAPRALQDVCFIKGKTTSLTAGRITPAMYVECNFSLTMAEALSYHFRDGGHPVDLATRGVRVSRVLCLHTEEHFATIKNPQFRPAAAAAVPVDAGSPSSGEVSCALLSNAGPQSQGSLNTDRDITAPGDSGAMVFDKDGRVLGVLVGSATEGTQRRYGLMTPMCVIENALGARVCDIQSEASEV